MQKHKATTFPPRTPHPFVRFATEPIRELLDETATAIRQGMPKIYSRELAELIFVNTYCRISDVVAADIAKRQTAAVYLKALAAEGLLEEIKAGCENLYINPPAPDTSVRARLTMCDVAA